MQYNKPPINIAQQINLLKQRGLIFRDEVRATHYLSNISYYRLRAYTYPFQDNSLPTHPFNGHITFEQIIELYVFDRKLRLLIFDAMEKIEVALRTKIIYTFALSHGSHWPENALLYRNHYRFANDLSSLDKEIHRSTETFIKHYKQTYTQPVNPPAWMSLEVTSLGLLSKLFENLKKGPEKRQITQAFGLNKIEILESWMHSFANVRNICAHHGRLWNRRFTAMPQLPIHTSNPFLLNKQIHPNKLYAILSCISYILRIITPQNNFNASLKDLILHCPLVDVKEMGFPNDWEKEVLWQS